jgi:hypothetical protein
VLELQTAVKASEIIRAWIEATNHKLKLIQNEKEDKKMKDEEITAFI